MSQPMSQNTLLPSGRGYLYAALLAGVTVAVLVVLALDLVKQMVGLFDLHTLQAPGRTTVTLDEAGSYTIYAVVDRRVERGAEPPPEPEPSDYTFTVKDAAGSALEVVDAESTTLTVNERGYLPLAAFRAPQPGDYEIEAARTEPVPGSEALAVGDSVSPAEVAGTAGRIGLLILIAVLGFGGALAFFLVTLLRRSGAARRLEEENEARLQGR